METMTEPEVMPEFVDIIPGEKLLRGVISALKDRVALDVESDTKEAEELPDTGAEAFIEDELGYENMDMPDLPDDICTSCFKNGEMCKCE